MVTYIYRYAGCYREKALQGKQGWTQTAQGCGCYSGQEREKAGLAQALHADRQVAGGRDTVDWI